MNGIAPESVDTPFTGQLEEKDIVEAIQLLLAKRGLLPASGAIGYFRWRFGLVGNPQIIMVGSGSDPNVGKVYVRWSYEVLDNVRQLPQRGT